MVKIFAPFMPLGDGSSVTTRRAVRLYLLALSVSNRGRLATFDSTISPKAVEGAAAQNLELLAAI